MPTERHNNRYNASVKQQFFFIILKFFKKVNPQRYSLTFFIIFDIIIMGKNMANVFAIKKRALSRPLSTC